MFRIHHAKANVRCFSAILFPRHSSARYLFFARPQIIPMKVANFLECLPINPQIEIKNQSVESPADEAKRRKQSVESNTWLIMTALPTRLSFIVLQQSSFLDILLMMNWSMSVVFILSPKGVPNSLESFFSLAQVVVAQPCMLGGVIINPICTQLVPIDFQT